MLLLPKIYFIIVTVLICPRTPFWLWQVRSITRQFWKRRQSCLGDFGWNASDLSFPSPLCHSGKITAEKDIAQEHICLGYPGVSIFHPDYYALVLANEVFGGWRILDCSNGFVRKWLCPILSFFLYYGLSRLWYGFDLCRHFQSRKGELPGIAAWVCLKEKGRRTQLGNCKEWNLRRGVGQVERTNQRWNENSGSIVLVAVSIVGGRE